MASRTRVAVTVADCLALASVAIAAWGLGGVSAHLSSGGGAEVCVPAQRGDKVLFALDHLESAGTVAGDTGHRGGGQRGGPSHREARRPDHPGRSGSVRRRVLGRGRPGHGRRPDHRHHAGGAAGRGVLVGRRPLVVSLLRTERCTRSASSTATCGSLPESRRRRVRSWQRRVPVADRVRHGGVGPEGGDDVIVRSFALT